MLVLSRKRGERIVIDENITVTVLDVRGDRVKLGFVAPVATPIQREEIRQEIDGRQPDLIHDIKYPFVSRNSEQR